MTTDELTYLQDWYARHCDGDWEHDARIRISTLDNPGWHLWVNIEGTELAGRLIARMGDAEGDDDWIDVRCDGSALDVACGPRGLGRALQVFREMADA